MYTINLNEAQLKALMELVMSSEIHKMKLGLGSFDKVETEVFWKVSDCMNAMYDAKGIKD